MCLLGYTPQAYSTCACPASRLKKEPGVRNRDISGLMEVGVYLFGARFWSDTLPCVVDGGQDMAGKLCSQGEGEVTSYRGN